jgi:hypothetical protein
MLSATGILHTSITPGQIEESLFDHPVIQIALCALCIVVIIGVGVSKSIRSKRLTTEKKRNPASTTKPDQKDPL